MTPNDLFDKIVKLEETSEEITNNSLKMWKKLKR